MKFFKRGRKNVDSKNTETELSPSSRTDTATSFVSDDQPRSPKRSPPNYANANANANTRSGYDHNRAAADEEYDVEESNINRPLRSKEGTQEKDEDYSLMIDGDPVYIVKQKRGYLSILFSLAQTVILFGMMIQCSVAPMKINPMFGPYPDVLSYWGAKNSYNILFDNEYWRLVTPAMLHAGIFHLLCNVAVQLDTGAFFEREWGSFIWLLIYVGSAASGSILSVIVAPNTIGVGSSGAVCGLFGAKIAEALCRCRESTKSSGKELSHAILCEQFGSTLCSVILILVFSFIPYVDWAAHVGGLLGGFIIGVMLFSFQIETWRWKLTMFSTGFLLSMMFYGTGILFMIREKKDEVAGEMADVCAYYAGYFEDYECNCRLGED